MTERFPFGPSTRPEPPLFPREQRVFRVGPRRPGREAAQRTLDGEDQSGTIKREGKGGASLLFGGPNRTVRGPVPVPKSYRVPS